MSPETSQYEGRIVDRISEAVDRFGGVLRDRLPREVFQLEWKAAQDFFESVLFSEF